MITLATTQEDSFPNWELGIPPRDYLPSITSEGRRVCRAFDWHEELENIELGIGDK